MLTGTRKDVVQRDVLAALKRYGERCLHDVVFGAQTLHSRDGQWGDGGYPTKEEVQSVLRSLKRQGRVACLKVHIRSDGNGGEDPSSPTMRAWSLV